MMELNAACLCFSIPLMQRPILLWALLAVLCLERMQCHMRRWALHPHGHLRGTGGHHLLCQVQAAHRAGVQHWCMRGVCLAGRGLERLQRDLRRCGCGQDCLLVAAAVGPLDALALQRLLALRSWQLGHL